MTQLFFFLALVGFFIQLAMYLWQDVEYTKENAERFEMNEKVVDALEQNQRMRKKPLLQGLDGK